MNSVYSQKLKEECRVFAEACTDCKLCVQNCTMLKEYCKSPREFIKQVSEELIKEVEIPYFCSLCRFCSTVCPKSLKLYEIFMKIREETTVQNKGKSPMKGHSSIEMHQAFSFSKLFNVTIPDKRAGFTKRVFIPGCSLSSYSPQLVKSIIEFLQEKLPGTGAILKCCGKPTLDMGQKELFLKRYEELQVELHRLGVEEVITACQNCYVTISKFSSSLRVKSLWTVIPDIGLRDDMKNKGKDSDMRFSIHDACPTRYNSEIHNGIRWIIKELGYTVEELDFSREKTQCCGYGGMVAPVNKELAKKIMSMRAEQCKGQYMITYCASCCEAMLRGGKKSLHILNLMFDKVYNSKTKMPDWSQKSLSSWKNRYLTRAKMHKLLQK